MRTMAPRCTNKVLIAIFAVVSAKDACGQNPATNFELNTALMESTFKIESTPTPGMPQSVGTVFIVGRDLLHPPPDKPTAGRYVLVTASHVLEEIGGDGAILHLRYKNPDGTWRKQPTALRIRENGRPLWVKHPAADVAAMYVTLPEGTSLPALLASSNFLATDETLVKAEIHPGDTLQCLGFPFGEESNEAGFPILRSGKIASYPLTPTEKTKTFLFDISVFGGNSGGPVYFVEQNRSYGGSYHFGNTVQFIAGLVTKETIHPEGYQGRYTAEIRAIPLNLATVVHATFIMQTIAMLPPPD